MPRRALRSYPTNYATDLTDEQWVAMAPLVATPSSKGGHPTEIDRRAIVNTLLDKHRTGCQWRMLPNVTHRQLHLAAPPLCFFCKLATLDDGGIDMFSSILVYHFLTTTFGITKIIS